MTSDDDTLATQLTLALKAPGSRELAPSEARERVALRLAASGGVLTFGASLAGASQASVSAAAVASAAPLVPAAVAVPAAATLTKVLAVGILLGSTASLGVHALSGGFGGGSPKTPLRTQEPSAVRAGAADAKEPAGSATTNSSPAVVSGDEAGEKAPASGVTAGAPIPQGAREEAHRETPPQHRLAEQQALLDRARAALRRGDANQALDAARAHHERFPDTVFEEERRAVVIRALLLLGREHDAHLQLMRFESAFPKSLLLPSLKQSFETKAPHDFVTEPPVLPQSDLER
jgi:hypothetical protein